MQLSPLPPQRFASVTIPDDRAVYRIKEGKFFGPDDRLYLEGEIIAWDEEPNTEMEPLNNLAREKFKAYIAKLDKYGAAVSEKNGTAYTTLADSYENAMRLAQHDSKRVQLLSSAEMIPLMGAKKTGGPNIEKLEASAETPMLGTPKKSNKFSLKRDGGRDSVNKIEGSAD